MDTSLCPCTPSTIGQIITFKQDVAETFAALIVNGSWLAYDESKTSL